MAPQSMVYQLLEQRDLSHAARPAGFPRAQLISQLIQKVSVRQPAKRVFVDAL